MLGNRKLILCVSYLGGPVSHRTNIWRRRMCACLGTEESAGKDNRSHRCPKGNRQMRRVLNQATNAAVKARGTIFAIVYRRSVPRLV